MELWFARGRQAGELPFLPAVSEVMWSGPVSCFHMPNLRHLPLMALGTGVGGVDLRPGGWATAEQVPVLVENDTCSLHVVQHPRYCMRPQICCPH